MGDGIEESRVNFTALYTAGNLTLEIFPYCGADGELDVMVSEIGCKGPSIKDVRFRPSYDVCKIKGFKTPGSLPSVPNPCYLPFGFLAIQMRTRTSSLLMYWASQQVIGRDFSENYPGVASLAVICLGSRKHGRLAGL